MKVMFINTVYSRGSTGRIIADLGQAIEDRGDDYIIAYGRGKKGDTRHCYRIGNIAGVCIHAGLSRITDCAGFYSAWTTKRLLNFIRAYKPDIIHLHNLHGYYINVKLLFQFLKAEYKGKVIWTLHDCWAFTGHCVYYTYAACVKWKTGCFSCIQKHEYPASMFLDRSEKNYQEKKSLFCGLLDMQIITVSDWLREEAQQSFLKEYNIKTIYNGIDTELFRNSSNIIRSRYEIGSKFMFLSVSDGWNSRKGYEKIFELGKYLNDHSVIVIVGLSKKQLKDLPDNVIGVEKTWNQQELVDFYSAADVLFNPSKEETFGLVTAEAMSCGTPAIVYQTTACQEIVGGEQYGLILKMNKEIPFVIDDLYLKKNKFSANCRKRIENDFSVDLMKNEYMKMYIIQNGNDMPDINRKRAVL